MTTKTVQNQEQWARVLQELDAEADKLTSYDHTMIPLFGDLEGAVVLDYGSGPGVLASMLQQAGAAVQVFDISSQMLDTAADKIGEQNVIRDSVQIPSSTFDIVVCNLVLCIVEQDEVHRILRNLQQAVHPDGRIFIGFCNPRIFQVKESQLDQREPTGDRYEQPHLYWKVKKEGGYRIVEMHRPISWYQSAFTTVGLRLLATHFTPQYELKGETIQDFVIFELSA